MKFCILGSALGTSDHLVFDNDHFSWVHSKPGDILCLGDTNKLTSLDYVAKLFRVDVPTFASLPHAKFFNKIGMGLSDVHWQHVLDPVTYQGTVKKVVECTQHVVDALEGSGYSSTLVKRLELLHGLERAWIDKRKYSHCLNIESDTTQISNLRSFQPDDQGFANNVQYDGVETSTGRMKIVSGPRILTLRKENRSIIGSAYGDAGEVISIDYASLEPRVALALNGITPEGDLYEWIDAEVFNGDLGRSKVKILTLSIIYGMSLHSARSGYGNVSVSQKKKLRSLFSVDETTNRLLSIPEDELRNYFGRPIFPSSRENVFNAFIQSTAVDTATLGFLEVISRLKAAGECRPLFLIHDEIICDVSNEVSSNAKKIFNDGIKINFNDKVIDFPVTVEKISVKCNRQ